VIDRLIQGLGVHGKQAAVFSVFGTCFRSAIRMHVASLWVLAQRDGIFFCIAQAQQRMAQKRSGRGVSNTAELL
jgi:hypothetical protein